MQVLKKMKTQLVGSDPLGMPQSGTNRIVHLPIHLVMPNPNQPRKYFNHDSLRELAESVRRYGVIQPITVRRKRDGTYEVVAGERRLRAAGLAGLLKVPAIITDMEDEDSAMVALIENVQRENLSFLEEAYAYRELLETCSLTQEALALRVGKSQGAIANKLRILKLPTSVREIVRDSSLSERHARALIKLNDEEKQIYVAKRVADLSMSVKQTEELVEKILKNGSLPEEKPRLPRSISDVRVFFKTIAKAINLMNEKGIDASAQKDETDSYYEYVIRICK